jgi:hypothetical protein
MHARPLGGIALGEATPRWRGGTLIVAGDLPLEPREDDDEEWLCAFLPVPSSRTSRWEAARHEVLLIVPQIIRLAIQIDHWRDRYRLAVAAAELMGLHRLTITAVENRLRRQSAGRWRGILRAGDLYEHPNHFLCVGLAELRQRRVCLAGEPVTNAAGAPRVGSRTATL